MSMVKIQPFTALFLVRPARGRAKKLTFLVPTPSEHRHAQNESKDRVATAKRRGPTRSP